MANFLNRPSIFDIATAYENGNNGEIYPMNDGAYGTNIRLY